ncbi:hypothetical protein L6R53_15290 [Myxococcota bacterium]|nr:hypothetical protein [Myxococcota bacterium]
MSPLLALPIALAAGCGSPPLSPDADLEGDAMVAALPADAALVARIDLEPRDLERWAQAGLVDPQALPLTGLPEALALACGVNGCLSLVEGPVAPRDEMAPRIDPHRWALAARDGDPLTWRRLAEDKAVAGEQVAVAALVRAHARGQAGLDPGSLQGAVPDGRAWLFAREPALLLDLARQRGLDLPDLPAEAAAVRSVALSVEPEGDLAWLTLRAVLVDEGEARRAARLLRVARVEGPAGTLLSRATVAREGAVVELQGAWITLDEVAAWLAAPQRAEVAP